MELKDSAFIALALSLVLALAAYFTGSLLFYAAFAVAALLVAGDYLWLRLGALSVKRVLFVSTQLSRSELSPGSSAFYTLKAYYSRHPGLALALEALVDGSIVTDPLDKKIWLRAGKECTMELKLVPTACGRFDTGHVKVTVSSMFFRDSFLAGADSLLRVRLTIGMTRVRHNVVFSSNKKYSRVYNSILEKRSGSDFSGVQEHGADSILEKRSGSDFSGVREYSAGDNIKHIDWALSARTGELCVREYEAERTLPAYILIDMSRPPAENGRDRVDFSVDTAVAFISRQLIDGDKLGLICFSKTGILYHLKPGMGRAHVNMLADILSKLRPEGDDAVSGCGPPVSLRELYDIGQAFERDAGLKTLMPIIKETIKEYTLNAREDGFIQAIMAVAGTFKSPCQIKLVTGLSMGLPSYMNGLRLARYYGHAVTTIVNSGGRDSERAAELKAAVSRLRAQSFMVITPGEPDSPGSILFGGGIGSGRRNVRG